MRIALALALSLVALFLLGAWPTQPPVAETVGVQEPVDDLSMDADSPTNGTFTWNASPTSTQRAGSVYNSSHPISRDFSMGGFRMAGDQTFGPHASLYRYNMNTANSGRTSSRDMTLRRNLSWQVDSGGMTCTGTTGGTGSLEGVRMSYATRVCSENGTTSCSSDGDCTGTCETQYQVCVVGQGGYLDSNATDTKFEDNVYHSSPYVRGEITAIAGGSGTCKRSTCVGGPLAGTLCDPSLAAACGPSGTCSAISCSADATCPGSYCQYVDEREELTLGNEAQGEVVPVCAHPTTGDVGSVPTPCDMGDWTNEARSSTCSQSSGGGRTRCQENWETAGVRYLYLIEQNGNGTRSDPDLDAGDFDDDGYLIGRQPWAQLQDAEDNASGGTTTTTTTAGGLTLTLDNLTPRFTEEKAYVGIFQPGGGYHTFLWRSRPWNRGTPNFSLGRGFIKMHAGGGGNFSTSDAFEVEIQNDRTRIFWEGPDLPGSGGSTRDHAHEIRAYLRPDETGTDYPNAGGLKLNLLYDPLIDYSEANEYFSLRTDCGVRGSDVSVVGGTTLDNNSGCMQTDVHLSDKFNVPNSWFIHDVEVSIDGSWSNQPVKSNVYGWNCPAFEGLGSDTGPSSCFVMEDQEGGNNNLDTGNAKGMAHTGFLGDAGESNQPWVHIDESSTDIYRSVSNGNTTLKLSESAEVDDIAIIDPTGVAAGVIFQWDATNSRLVPITCNNNEFLQTCAGAWTCTNGTCP